VIKSFPNVEEGGLLPSVKPTSIVANKHEVVMNASGLDKRTLRLRDNVIHTRGKPPSKNLCHNLGEPMDEANRPKVGDLFGPLLLWEEHNASGVKPM
jgi:hypothetical protein